MESGIERYIQKHFHSHTHSQTDNVSSLSAKTSTEADPRRTRIAAHHPPTSSTSKSRYSVGTENSHGTERSGSKGHGVSRQPSFSHRAQPPVISAPEKKRHVTFLLKFISIQSPLLHSGTKLQIKYSYKPGTFKEVDGLSPVGVVGENGLLQFNMTPLHLHAVLEFNPKRATGVAEKEFRLSLKEQINSSRYKTLKKTIVFDLAAYLTNNKERIHDMTLTLKDGINIKLQIQIPDFQVIKDTHIRELSPLGLEHSDDEAISPDMQISSSTPHFISSSAQLSRRVRPENLPSFPHSNNVNHRQGPSVNLYQQDQSNQVVELSQKVDRLERMIHKFLKTTPRNPLKFQNNSAKHGQNLSTDSETETSLVTDDDTSDNSSVASGDYEAKVPISGPLVDLVDLDATPSVASKSVFLRQSGNRPDLDWLRRFTPEPSSIFVDTSTLGVNKSSYVDNYSEDDCSASRGESPPSSASNSLKNSLQMETSGPLWSEDVKWNLKFQDAIDNIEAITPDTPLPEKIERHNILANLAQDFEFTALNWAKIIISEIMLPFDEKTIKPVSSLGGIGGGEKYVVRGIIFKFAADSKKIFKGNDEKAIKAADGDLKGLTAYFNCGVRGLYHPFLMLVDFLGFRLIAMSKIPIGPNSLKYGSCDGGNTIFVSDPKLNKCMKETATALNLAPHSPRKDEHLTIYSCTDLEGHLGLDGRYYLLDYSRSLVPEPPNLISNFYRDTSQSCFYRFLRQELIKQHPNPLNPDTFSAFAAPKDREASEQEIKVATQHLFKTIIPQFAVMLAQSRDHNSSLISQLHARGINIRHLGLLRSYLINDDHWTREILLEAISRTLKRMIQRSLRDQRRTKKEAGLQPYKRTIVENLNLIFGYSANSDQFWRLKVRSLVSDKFPLILSPAELAPEYDLKKSINAEMLLDRLGKSLGLVFQNLPNVKSVVQHQLEEPIDITDITDLEPVKKVQPIVSLAQGYVLKNKFRLKQSAHFREDAIARFNNVLHYLPNTALVHVHLGDLYRSKDQHMASLYYLQALKLDSKNPTIAYKYALHLANINCLQLAEEYFSLTLQLDPSFSLAYIDFSNLLFREKQWERASSILQQALKVVTIPKYRSVLNHNFGLLLLKRPKESPTEEQDDYRKCEQYLRESAKSGNPAHKITLLWFLHHIKGEEAGEGLQQVVPVMRQLKKQVISELNQTFSNSQVLSLQIENK